MAAANYVKSDEIKRETDHLEIGHTFSFVFPIKDLSLHQKLTFREEFMTECEMEPTSWLYEMFFQKVLEDGRASVLVTLKRTDENLTLVNVNIVLRLKDSAGKDLFHSPKIVRNGVGFGQLIREQLTQNLPSPEMQSNFNEKLQVVAFIDVKRCHYYHNVASFPRLRIRKIPE